MILLDDNLIEFVALVAHNISGYDLPEDMSDLFVYVAEQEEMDEYLDQLGVLPEDYYYNGEPINDYELNGVFTQLTDETCEIVVTACIDHIDFSSRLIHEMVHYFQYKHGVPYEDNTVLCETEAYRAEEIWWSKHDRVFEAPVISIEERINA